MSEIPRSVKIIVALVVCGAIGFVLYRLFITKDLSLNTLLHKSRDTFEVGTPDVLSPPPVIQIPTLSSAQPTSMETSQTLTIPKIDNNIFKPLANSELNQNTTSNFTLGVNINDPVNSKFLSQAPEQQPRLTSNDLLPSKTSNNWFDTPDVGIKIEDANLLVDAINKVGVDTVGQTRKNPSYDIRGTVPCPKFVVSPWNNSTIEPDINLKSLY